MPPGYMRQRPAGPMPNPGTIGMLAAAATELRRAFPAANVARSSWAVDSSLQPGSKFLQQRPCLPTHFARVAAFRAYHRVSRAHSAQLLNARGAGFEGLDCFPNRALQFLIDGR